MKPVTFVPFSVLVLLSCVGQPSHAGPTVNPQGAPPGSGMLPNFGTPRLRVTYSKRAYSYNYIATYAAYS